MLAKSVIAEREMRIFNSSGWTGFRPANPCGERFATMGDERGWKQAEPVATFRMATYHEPSIQNPTRTTIGRVATFFDFASADITGHVDSAKNGCYPLPSSRLQQLTQQLTQHLLTLARGKHKGVVQVAEGFWEGGS